MQGRAMSPAWKGEEFMDENRNEVAEQQTETQPQAEPQQYQPQTEPQQYRQPRQTYQPQYQPQPQQPAYQSQAQYGYRPQPQYAAPVQYPQYIPEDTSRHGKGGGWIAFMRVITWILFVIIELAVVIGGVVQIIAASSRYYYDGGMVISGILTIIVGTFMAFLLIAETMIFLDLAKNVKNIASSTADTNAKLDDISRRIGR